MVFVPWLALVYGFVSLGKSLVVTDILFMSWFTVAPTSAV